MDDSLNNIDILVAKFLSGNASADEIRKVNDWKLEAEQNQIIFKRAINVWKKSDPYITAGILEQDRFKLESEYSWFLSKKYQKTRLLSLIYKIAAIIAFPLALAVSWYLYEFPRNTTNVVNQYCQVTSPKGHVSKCILPDGTEIWVNTGSTIKYNTGSFNLRDREVYLEGEAYFEVITNKEKPFRVITKYADINATGTSFNVLAYPEDSVFETVLAEGKVNLQFKSGLHNILSMDPGERIILNVQNSRLDIKNVDTEMYTSWRNGELIFKDATLNDLVNELEHIYDINFHISPKKLGDLRFRGMFSYNNNLILALEKVKKTSGIDYYIENKEVWLKKSN